MKSLLDAFFDKAKNKDSDATVDYHGDISQFDTNVKFEATVHGRVQGVGFRFSTKNLADELGIKGIVRNEPDGTVYVEAVGDKKQCERFIEGLRIGPSPAAQVKKVVVHYNNSIKDYKNFSQAN